MSKQKQKQDDLFQNAGEKIEEQQPEKRFNPDKGIEEIVGVFCDPIIVMPGGWGDTLPPWIKEAITLERLIANMEGFRRGAMTATDAEACAYLYTACLEAAPSHDWAQIYLYVATKVYERHRTKDSGVTMPADIRVEELTRNQQDDLAHLKGWIYHMRSEHRAKKAKDIRKERLAKEKQEEQDKAPEVVQHTFDLG